MTSIRKPGWPTFWPALPNTQPIGLTISSPGIGALTKHASARQPDLGRHLSRLHHQLCRPNARRGRGLASRAVDRHVPRGPMPARLRGRPGWRNRLHRAWHRELETAHRRHASRWPRASSDALSRVALPRCSPEAYVDGDVAADGYLAVRE